MADAAAVPGAHTVVDDPYADDTPGSLTIRRRVYERLAEQAALAVSDVLAQSVGLSAAFDDQTASGAVRHRNLPRAMVGDDGTQIALALAVRWPSRLDEVCADVRDRVSEDVLRFTGDRPQRVDVEVAQLVSDAPSRTGGAVGDNRAPAAPRRTRPGFIDLPPVGEQVDLAKAGQS